MTINKHLDSLSRNELIQLETACIKILRCLPEYFRTGLCNVIWDAVWDEVINDGEYELIGNLLCDYKTLYFHCSEIGYYWPIGIKWFRVRFLYRVIRKINRRLSA